MAVTTARRFAWPSFAPWCATCSISWSCGPCTWNPCPDMSSSWWFAVVGGPTITKAGVGRLNVARGGREGGTVPWRKERVPVQVGVDLGEQKLVGERQRLRVDLGAADHEGLRRVGRARQRGAQRFGALGA